MGALVAALPFLGFPIHIDNILMVGIGVIVIALGVAVRRRSVAARARTRTHQTYVESTPKVHGEAHEAA